MTKPFFNSKVGVTLIGAGMVVPAKLQAALALAPSIVSADGGADAALRLGLVPDAVIGDMDSVGDAAREMIPADRFCRIAEQDSTDFDKALRNIAAPVVIGVGFEGGRIDHMLACYSVLVQRAAQPCILMAGEQIVFAAPKRLDLAVEDGDLVSLFPMTEVQGRSTGLAWPIEGLAMAPNNRIGTSNRASGRVSLEMESPGMLVIVADRALGLVVQALRSAESW